MPRLPVSRPQKKTTATSTNNTTATTTTTATISSTRRRTSTTSSQTIQQQQPQQQTTIAPATQNNNSNNTRRVDWSSALNNALFQTQVGLLWATFRITADRFESRQHLEQNGNRKGAHPRKRVISQYSRLCDRILDYKYKTPDELKAIILRSFEYNNADTKRLPEVLTQMRNSRFVLLFLAIQPIEILKKFRDCVESKLQAKTPNQNLKIELVAIPERIPFFRFRLLDKPSAPAKPKPQPRPQPQTQPQSPQPTVQSPQPSIAPSNNNPPKTPKPKRTVPSTINSVNL